MNKSWIRFISSLFFGLSLLYGGCATHAAPAPTAEAEGLPNFHKVNDHVYRGAQPEAAGIERLKKLGVKTVVNLRLPDDAWEEEPATVKKAGMTYINVPMSGIGRPVDEQVKKVLAIIASSKEPVFVHCQMGCDRTGTVMACYRMQHDKWSKDKAFEEAKALGMLGWEYGMKSYIDDFADSQKGK